MKEKPSQKKLKEISVILFWFNFAVWSETLDHWNVYYNCSQGIGYNIKINVFKMISKINWF